MTPEQYEEYVVLDSKIKELTKQKNDIRSQIIDEMTVGAETSKETAFGKFTISQLKTWTYTDKVVEMEDNYKALKASEESTGEATFIEKPSLRFTAIRL